MNANEPMKTLSDISDIHAFVIRPKAKNAIVTLADQRKLKEIVTWRRAKFVVRHFSTKRREELIDELKNVRLSKAMIVTEITDAQWGRRFRDGETIEGTGIKATKAQLAKSFEIGQEKSPEEANLNRGHLITIRDSRHVGDANILPK
jgi:hypothetical protein